MSQPGEFRVDDDDWFGEGSSFDSGEELAAALFSLGAPHPAGISVEAGGGSPNGPGEQFESPRAARASLSSDSGQIPGAGQGEFATLERISSPGGGGDADAGQWSVVGTGPAPAGARAGGWRIRQGVRSLRRAEEALDKLREDAIAVTWAAAAVALRRSRGDP